jgi:hypothetical protein
VESVTIGGEGVTVEAGAAEINLDAGDEADLTVTVLPENANNYTLSWASDDTDVVTVNADSGHISAQGVMTDSSATITVTAVDKDDTANNKTAAITVNVAKGIVDKSYSVSSAAELAAAMSEIQTDVLDDDKQYTVTITEDLTLSTAAEMINVTSSLDSKTITLTDGGMGKTIYMGAAKVAPVITVATAAKFILTGNITIVGAGTLTDKNTKSIVEISGNGIFVLDGSAKLTGNIAGQGAGVKVLSGGCFEMKGGEISGNTSVGGVVDGAGVYVSTGGKFYMTGGIIAGNKIVTTGNSRGCGVNLGSNITFEKTGGIIYGDEDTVAEALRNTITKNGVRQTASGAAIRFLIGPTNNYREETIYENHKLSVVGTTVTEVKPE